MCLNENSRVISEEHVCPPRLELDEHGSLASGGSSVDDEGSSEADYNDDDLECDASASQDAHCISSSRFCTNCTSRMSVDEDVCDDCGHCTSKDDALFATTQIQPPGAACKEHKIALLYDERMELHVEGAKSPHPERPDRIRAVVARILSTGLGDQCQRIACREATTEELIAVHTKELVKMVADVSQAHSLEDGNSSPIMITPDTYANEHTNLCALLAAGSAAEVACMVASGKAPHGAAIVRPPGHHAESGMAMGFCFFNNAAVAARAAQTQGSRRVIILDWDIHHGNGTQHIFEDDPTVLYMSLHRYDGGSFYPGTGGVGEVGSSSGRGFTVNIPWDSSDMGNGDYLSAFNQVLIPIAYEFNPDLIIVSAGFDAADGDPIGECRVTPECFAHMTSMLKAIAPLVLILEGGYNLTSTALSTEACLRVLLGEQPGCLPGRRYPSTFGWKAIQEAIAVQSEFWHSLSPPKVSIKAQAEVSCWDQPRRHEPSDANDPQRSDTPQHFCFDEVRGQQTYPRRRSPRLQYSRVPLSKSRILLAIHRRAMRAFWSRRRRSMATHL